MCDREVSTAEKSRKDSGAGDSSKNTGERTDEGREVARNMGRMSSGKGAQGAGVGTLSPRRLCPAGTWGSALRRMPAWEAGEAASAGRHRGQTESIALGRTVSVCALGLPFLILSLLGVSSPPQDLLFPTDLFPMVTDKAKLLFPTRLLSTSSLAWEEPVVCG